MDEWSIGEVVIAALLVGIPLLSAAGWLRQMLIDVRAARRLKRMAIEREDRRKPAPGTSVVEGRVIVPESGALDVVTRRQFGCLGGPLIHVVPAFEIELDDGTRRSVEVGNDPVVENLELLKEPSSNANSSAPSADLELVVPTHTGAPESVVPLRGRVRVAGVVPVEGAGVAPPEGASARLTILATAGTQARVRR
jgi:hypothetical protein